MAGGTLYSRITFPPSPCHLSFLGLSVDGWGYIVFQDNFSTLPLPPLLPRNVYGYDTNCLYAINSISTIHPISTWSGHLQYVDTMTVHGQYKTVRGSTGHPSVIIHYTSVKQCSMMRRNKYVIGGLPNPNPIEELE
jgi:hypothetical protein